MRADARSVACATRVCVSPCVRARRIFDRHRDHVRCTARLVAYNGVHGLHWKPKAGRIFNRPTGAAVRTMNGAASGARAAVAS
jgi:hypothetical protein